MELKSVTVVENGLCKARGFRADAITDSAQTKASMDQSMIRVSGCGPKYSTIFDWFKDRFSIAIRLFWFQLYEDDGRCQVKRCRLLWLKLVFVRNSLRCKWTWKEGAEAKSLRPIMPNVSTGYPSLALDPSRKTATCLNAHDRTHLCPQDSWNKRTHTQIRKAFENASVSCYC